MRALAASLPPPLSGAAAATARKGGAGRVFVVGGSAEYSGAPYFAGMSALRSGADLTWVLCAPGAATAIKTLAPDLIVVPTLGTPDSAASFSSAMARATSFVVGPGLGRSPSAWTDARFVINEARNSGRPVVVDGDALWWCSSDLAVIRGHPTAVLTPNGIELIRLCEGAGVSSAADLAAVLGVSVLAKGNVDLFAGVGARETVCCSILGAPRRCGGQGDVLAGALGTWLGWAYNTTTSADTTANANTRTHTHTSTQAHTRADRVAAAVIAAATVTRVAAAKAFAFNKRSTITADILAQLPHAFEECFPVG